MGQRRIFFVIDNLRFGGGERVFSQLINGLSLGDYEVHLASHSNPDLYQTVKQATPQTYTVDFKYRININTILKLVRVIRQNSIDVVHGQGARAEFHARIATKFAGNAKYVSTTAMPVEGFDVGPLKKYIYRLFDRLTERFVDKFIVVSDELKALMIGKRGISSEKVVRIYNGIELDQYSPETNKHARRRIREELGLIGDSVLIGAIGRLVWQKGFKYLINAMPEILKFHPDSKILIVGEGPLREKLGAVSRELRVSNKIIFAGFRTDVKEILSAIDIVVIPSLLEGFPMITLEAMAMAKPIVATKIDGIKEQIEDGKTGIFVPPKDPLALSSAVAAIMQNYRLATNIGLHARKKVEDYFSVEKMVNETEKAYHSLFNNVFH